MTLTERIKLLCKPLNYTFASIEREFEFGQGTIRKWDNSVPSADKLLKVAQLLNTTIDWLLTGEGEPHSKSQLNDYQDISATNTKTPEAAILFKIYNSLDEKKQHIVLQKALELANEK